MEKEWVGSEGKMMRKEEKDEGRIRWEERRCGMVQKGREAGEEEVERRTF